MRREKVTGVEVMGVDVRSGEKVRAERQYVLHK